MAAKRGRNPTVTQESGGPPEAPGKGKPPGWYPLGENSNDQTYWDGESWIARRRWDGAGWSDLPVDLSRAPSVPTASYRSDPVGVYGASARPLGARAPLTSVTAGPIVLFLSGVVMMIGSVTSWVSVDLLGHSLSASGTDSGISAVLGLNGWITFIAGVVLLLLGGLMIVSSEPSLRLLAVLVALASLGVAIYAVIRVLWEISRSHPAVNNLGQPASQLLSGTSESIGFGLVLVLVAAVGATLAAALEVRSI